MKFQLRFDSSKIVELAGRYSYPKEDTLTDIIGPAVRQRGHFTRDEFLSVAEWKSPRNRKRYALNDDGFITAATRTALSSPHERLRIEVLILLYGVSWPTASVLLHFGHPDPYPILDFRALWSLGVDVPADSYGFYNFALWWEYTVFCRGLAKECRVSMRGLDRALWQYSKESQKVGQP
jgi:hypothetical protein